MMKKTITLLLAGLLLLQFTACDGAGKDGETTAATTEEAALATPGVDALTDEDKAAYQTLIAQNAERAAVIGATLEEYYITAKGSNIVVAEKVNTNTMASVNVGSVWNYGAVMSMASRLSAINAAGQGEHYADLYKDLYEGMDYYKGTDYITDYTATRQQTLFAVNRAGAKGQADLSGIAAVYDDQMWIIREMVYAYQQTGTEDYLQLALSLTQACLDGWDTSTDATGKEYGGICWGPGYSTKHTCSNAPIIEPLVEIYEIFVAEGRENADYYLEWAKKVYSWTTRLTASGGLYGDLLGSSRELTGSGKRSHYETTSQDKNIDKTTYTYNTGAMISGAAALYRVTGEESYLRAAKRSAKAAHEQLGNSDYKEGYVMYPTNPLTNWFDLILLQGYIDLFPYDESCKEYIDCYQRSIDYAYDNYLTEEGFLPRNFLTGWSKNAHDTEKYVMDQASCAEVYATLAEFYASLTAAE